MITEFDIKPIPKNILNRIKKLDLQEQPKPNGNTRFYKYFTQYKRELCEVVVAVRNYRKNWFCKQVVVHGIHTDKVYLRDIGLTMGFYKVGWYREGISRYPHWIDYDWGYNDAKYFNIHAHIINREYVSKLSKYKYSAVDMYEYSDVLNYLRFYEKYPKCELLVKAGLSNLATSIQILRFCEEDKNFCKWLFKNRYKAGSGYYISSIINAYKHNKDIEEVYNFEKFKKQFVQKDNFKELKTFLKSNERDKFLKYLVKQKIDGYSYEDYRKACEYLRLDMNDDKNRYPHDFKKWHDIRIDQYHTKKAEEDERKRKELYQKFANVANKYLSLERLIVKDDYVCLIAKSPQQLVYEGEQLHHCVGKMNYDQKFAREESLIFFIRYRLNPNTPLVTLEYSIKNHKILQCYGEHDTRPSEDILTYVNKKWLPYANRKLRQIAI